MATRWEDIPNFKPEEFNAPDETKHPDICWNILYIADALQALRDFVNNAISGSEVRFKINVGYSTSKIHTPTSAHRVGLAADLVMIDRIRGPLPLMEQYELACKHGLFRRIGCYPNWNTPGLHLDLKPGARNWHWWRNRKLVYIEITKQNYDYAMGLRDEIYHVA